MYRPAGRSFSILVFPRERAREMKLEPLEAAVRLFSAHTSGERVLRGPQTAHNLGGVLPQKTKLYIGRYKQIQVLGQKTLCR
jgi:hypothetical protein